MKYIGNYPEQEIVHTWADRYDYVYASNPTVDINPAIPNCNWLNSATGEVFVCIDNTVGANVWKGDNGTAISILPTSGLIFKWDSKLLYKEAIDSVSSVNGTAGINLSETTGYGHNLHRFSAVGDKIVIPTLVDLRYGSYTISMWILLSEGVLPNLGSSYRGIFGGDKDAGNAAGVAILLVADTSGDLKVLIGTSGTELNKTGLSQGLHHIILTKDNLNLFKFYIDGTLADSATADFSTYSAIYDNFWIGEMYQSGGDRWFDGSIGDVRLFNRDITQAEVTALYNEGA